MLTLAIQAGGESSRMSQDKGLMPFCNQPLVLHVIQRLRPLADEILVTTNHPQNYRFLNLRLTRDVYPGRGPLGGLYTALHAAQYPLVAVAACDMPFASLELFQFARDRLLEMDLDAVVPSTAQGPEPLHAVYRRQACLPKIQSALDAGEWKIITWFPQAKVHILSPEETNRHDPHGMAFINLNTPQEFQQAEEKARQSKIQT